MTNISQKGQPKMDRYLGMIREDDYGLGDGTIMIKGDENNPQPLDIRFRVENSFVYLERYNGSTWDILGTWGGSFQTDKIYLNNLTGVKGIFDNTDPFLHTSYIRTTTKKGGIDIGDQDTTVYITAKDLDNILLSYPGIEYSKDIVTSIDTLMPPGTYNTSFTWTNPTSEFTSFIGYVDVPSKGRLIIKEAASGNVIWENMTEAEYTATGGSSSIEAIRDIDGNIIDYKTTGYVEVAVNPPAYLYQNALYDVELIVSEGNNLGDGTFPYFVVNGLESISIPITSLTTHFLDSGNEFYVDGVNGNDSNNGKNANLPFKTIQKAIDLCTANSVINVNGGTYTENLSIVNKSTHIVLGGETNSVIVNGTLDISATSNTHLCINGGEILGLTTLSGNAVLGGGIHFRSCKLSGGHTISGTHANPISFNDCYLIGVGSVNYIPLNASATVQYRDSFMANMTSMTVSGLSVVAFSICNGLPVITHQGGYLGISDSVLIRKNINGHCLVSTANLAATNHLIISNTSCYQEDMTYGIINKTGTCTYVLTKVSRSGLDILNGTRLNVDVFDNISAGVYTRPTITDNENNTVTLSVGDYCFYPTADKKGNICKVQISGATYNLTSNTANYIVGDYNNGVPIIRVTTNVNEINQSNIIPIFTVISKDGLHSIDWNELACGLSNKLSERLIKTDRFRLQQGLNLSTGTGGKILISDGIVWYGATPISLDASDSSINQTRLFYRSSGVWTYSNVTAYNSTQYDNGTNLVTLTPSRYAVNWVYRGVEHQNHIYILLGSGDYKLDEAQNAKLPTAPFPIAEHCILVGKIISAYSTTTPVEVTSAFDRVFAGNSTTTTLDVANMPVYESNATAKSGGLANGTIYRTSTGVLMVVY